MFDLGLRHRLVPDSVHQALRCYQSMASNSMALKIFDDDIVIATLIISGLVPKECAELDMIPKPQYFRNGYKRQLIDVMSQLWPVLFGELKLRRLTSYVPKSRIRTRRALKCLGFKQEGILRDGIKLSGKQPEDLYVLGLLQQEAVRPEEDDHGIA